MKNFNEKWINLLDQDLFKKVTGTSKSEPLAIMKCRRLMMQKRKGKLNLEYANCLNIDTLQELLQEMFLEPVPVVHIKFLYKQATKKCYNDMNEAFIELERKHKLNQNSRFLNLALTL